MCVWLGKWKSKIWKLFYFVENNNGRMEKSYLHEFTIILHSIIVCQKLRVN